MQIPRREGAGPDVGRSLREVRKLYVRSMSSPIAFLQIHRDCDDKAHLADGAMSMPLHGGGDMEKAVRTNAMCLKDRVNRCNCTLEGGSPPS